jgi:hypothetical protein
LRGTLNQSDRSSSSHANTGQSRQSNDRLVPTHASLRAAASRPAQAFPPLTGLRSRPSDRATRRTALNIEVFGCDVPRRVGRPTPRGSSGPNAMPGLSKPRSDRQAVKRDDERESWRCCFVGALTPTASWNESASWSTPWARRPTAFTAGSGGRLWPDLVGFRLFGAPLPSCLRPRCPVIVTGDDGNVTFDVPVTCLGWDLRSAMRAGYPIGSE